MSDRKREWKKWLKDSQSKGYSKDYIKKILKEQGYNQKEINQVLKLEATDQKKIIYLIILTCIMGIFIFFFTDYIQEQRTPRTIQNSQRIFHEVKFLNITADKISAEERVQLLNELENIFNKQCLQQRSHLSQTSSVPSYTCFPFVIYSYVETRKQLGVPQEEVHTDLSSKVLNLWEEYYEKVEFNKEGFVIGEPSFLINSLVQFHYFIALMPKTEREFWFEKVSGVSPIGINLRFHLLKIYWEYFNVSKLSQIPEGKITQEDVENICHNNLIMEEEWTVCAVLYFFKIREFCEIEITRQEINIAQQKLEIETQDRDLQACKSELQKMIH